MKNKFKLEWIIKFRELELGVIRNTSAMFSDNTTYIDCNKSCSDCKHFLNRSLMLPPNEDNDFCLDSEVIKRYNANKDEKKEVFECSPYLRG